MTDYYHYTNAAGMQGIQSSLCILESSRPDDGDDARFGRGVYLTTIDPGKGKRMIIEKCWGPNQFPAFVNNGRVDYAIRVRLSPNQVKRTPKNQYVYLHKGPLHLSGLDWEIIQVPNKC